MHWVYILRCNGFDDEIGLHDRHLDRIYIGETTRLFRRLKEHCGGDWGDTRGSVTTCKYRPIRLLGLYKIEDDYGLSSSLSLEDKITLQYMKAMGRKWTQVFGGKWHTGHPRNINPSKDFTIDRPYCKCNHPADIKEWNGKKYWRCSQKNFWDELKDKLEDLGLNFGGSNPCDYYRPCKENDTFDECGIYGLDENTIQLTGQCLIDSDEE